MGRSYYDDFTRYGGKGSSHSHRRYLPPERLLKKKMQGEPEKIGSRLRERAGGLMTKLIAATRAEGKTTLKNRNTGKVNNRVVNLRVLTSVQRLANRLPLKCLLPQSR